MPSANNVFQCTNIIGDVWSDEWRSHTHLIERQYLLFALMLSKEFRESVEVADDEVSACLMVKGVRRDRQGSYQS